MEIDVLSSGMIHASIPTGHIFSQFGIKQQKVLHALSCSYRMLQNSAICVKLESLSYLRASLARYDPLLQINN